MAPRRDNRVKVSAIFRAGHKVSDVTFLVGLAQRSMRSKIKITAQTDNRAKVSLLLRAGHIVGELANLVEISRTTVYAIKKRMDDGEGVNRRVGSGR